MKNTSKVLTGYSNIKDADAHTTAKSIITGCTNNTLFTFTTELTNLVLLDTDYVDRLGKVATGTSQDVVNKNESKAKLKTGLKVICTEINHQQAGNTWKAVELNYGPMLIRRREATIQLPTV